MGPYCRHVESLCQPCFPARAGGRRRDRRRQRLGPDASGPARCRRAARRRDAALSEASFLRRIYLRPQLGERLHPRRRKLLSENAVSGALHPGDRPAISRRRCRARPRRAASRRASAAPSSRAFSTAAFSAAEAAAAAASSGLCLADAAAPFGLVSLSAHDSEGAADMVDAGQPGRATEAAAAASSTRRPKARASTRPERPAEGDRAASSRSTRPSARRTCACGGWAGPHLDLM